ncbi:MAG TPA: hypothetical protein VG894_00760 [Bauldia sp.]|nr:hypothetical protein [Bauldia sp.]
MAVSLPYRFMLSGIIFAIVGMALGIWMGTREDFTYAPVHAHINLVGWASLFLFGLFYRATAAAAETTIASVHFWCALAGAVCLAIGIYGTLTPGSPVAFFTIPGALLTLASMLIFLWVVWRAAQRAD